jgi:hypothetical protein
MVQNSCKFRIVTIVKSQSDSNKIYMKACVLKSIKEPTKICRIDGTTKHDIKNVMKVFVSIYAFLSIQILKRFI